MVACLPIWYAVYNRKTVFDCIVDHYWVASTKSDTVIFENVQLLALESSELLTEFNHNFCIAYARDIHQYSYLEDLDRWALPALYKDDAVVALLSI